MSRLDEIQSGFRDSLIRGDSRALASLLVGGRYPEKRLTVHQRNYESSLIDALLTKFPATAWLIGTPILIEAAKRYVRESPPTVPCIAEYGADFPDFLQRSHSGERLPYLRDFVRLEWHVGKAAIAVDQPPITAADLLAIDPESLLNTFFTVQAGVHYQHTFWPVDELLKMYLADTAPAEFNLVSGDVWIEVCGARGEFRLNRLNEAEFMFRKCVSQGLSIGDAAQCALNIGSDFDPGNALTAMLATGLVTGVRQNNLGNE